MCGRVSTRSRGLVHKGKCMDKYLLKLSTEMPNENTNEIDLCSTEEMLTIINDEDMKVPSVVRDEIPQIAEVVDEIVKRLKSGGRLFYFGAGTSGRLGVLDASECPPTYGTDSSLVQAYIAGGDDALRNAAEGLEDSVEKGEAEVVIHEINEKDVVVGITASGRTPYVTGLVKKASERGAFTVGLTTNKGSVLEQCTDICIAPDVGNEVITGSTRMKSGTAQKLVLNMISTGTMIKLGKVYGNQMVDLRASNEKLRERAIRIFCNITDASEEDAKDFLQLSGMDTKLAIMMYCSKTDAEKAEEILRANDGFLRKAIADPDYKDK